MRQVSLQQIPIGTLVKLTPDGKTYRFQDEIPASRKGKIAILIPENEPYGAEKNVDANSCVYLPEQIQTKEG